MTPMLVSAMHVYPIKSCGGSPVTSSLFSASGAANDRLWRVTKKDGNTLIQPDAELNPLAAKTLDNFLTKDRKTVVDQQLYDLDVRVFGIEPSVWMGRFHHPLLTDWMSITYGLYFNHLNILARNVESRAESSSNRNWYVPR